MDAGELIGTRTAITALQELVPRLLSTTQPYILTYKLSQDPVELFFNAIRAGPYLTYISE